MFAKVDFVKCAFKTRDLDTVVEDWPSRVQVSLQRCPILLGQKTEFSKQNCPESNQGKFVTVEDNSRGLKHICCLYSKGVILHSKNGCNLTDCCVWISRMNCENGSVFLHVLYFVIKTSLRLCSNTKHSKQTWFTRDCQLSRS